MNKPRKKLAISCSDSDCSNGLHCFRVTKRKVTEYSAGACQACGDNPIDWERVQQRSIQDINHTLEALNHELIRNVFLKMPLGQDAINYAMRKGRVKLQVTVRKRLVQSISRAHPFRDGTQTPLLEDSPNPIWNAQHATATCCRRCAEYWHGIPRGRQLSDAELDYLTGLVNAFLDEKLPSLSDNPTAIHHAPEGSINVQID